MSDACFNCGTTSEPSLKNGKVCWDHVTCEDRRKDRRLALLERIAGAARKALRLKGHGDSWVQLEENLKTLDAGRDGGAE